MIREFGFIDVMYLVGAARWTLLLTITAFAGASVIGLAIAIARILPFAPVRWLAAGYIHIVQGTPLLVWLFLIFFGLPLIGISVNPWLAAVIGLVELTREGQLTAAGTYKPFAVYITVACIYFLMCFPLTQWSRSLERKLDVAR